LPNAETLLHFDQEKEEVWVFGQKLSEKEKKKTDFVAVYKY